MEIIGSAFAVPVRCVDIGGWLDTWFAKYGKILNLGVLSRFFSQIQAPFRGIDVIISQDDSLEKGIISIRAADPTYDVQISIKDLLALNFPKNLLLATLYLVELNNPHEKSLNLYMASPIPPGASLGTSAAVSVALIKALSDSSKSNQEIAQMAWRAETEIMGGQSGTQDQFAAAFGYGVNKIEVTDFPETSCQEVVISDSLRKKLEEGLITVCYGKHNSTESHLRVIKELELEGPEAPRLQRLRPLADEAERALLNKDLKDFGNIMQKNTAAQRELCEGIVSRRAESIIKIAQNNGALGWKVNGAGGDGGSTTLLFDCKDKAEKFYDDCQIIYPPEARFVYLEHKLAG